MKRLIAIGLTIALFGLLVMYQLRAAHAQLMLNAQIGAPPNATPAPTPTPPPGVNLTTSSFPGTYATIQAAINANPASTRFNFACGVYRLPTTGDTTLTPKSGDSFIGQNADTSYPSGEVTSIPSSPPCAEFTGAQVVSGWSGSNPWTKVVTGSFDSTVTEGCNTTTLNACSSPAGCSYPQDLFFTPVGDANPVQDAVMKPRTLTNPPPAGFWYFDFATKTVKVGDDPTGFVVELTTTPQLMSSTITNVTLQNFTIDKFATPNQLGVIEPKAQGWNVWNNWVTHGHGEGPKFRPGSTGGLIAYNEIIEMGQGGGGAGGDSNDTFDHNDVTRTNVDGVCYGQENGTKFSGSNGGVVVSNNTFKANNAVGLWADVEETGATFTNNTVIDNLHDGIRWETSHHGIISNNTVTNNAQKHADQCVAAGVPAVIHSGTSFTCTGPQTASGTAACVGSGFSVELVTVNSDGATITGNTTTSNCSGIVILAGARQPTYGNRVTSNSMTFNGLTTAAGTVGLGGSTEGASTCSTTGFSATNCPLFTAIAANTSDPTWIASHSYTLGTEIQDSNGNLQRVTTAGTSKSGTHPVWSTTLGGTTSDGGTLVWTVKASDYFSLNTYTWNSPSGSGNNWVWGTAATNTLMNFATWQSDGQDNP